MPPRPRYRRIVAADDDPMLLAFLATTLRDAGHCVFTAYDAEAACELTLVLDEVDLMITNTRLGSVSARELIRAEAPPSHPARRRAAAQHRRPAGQCAEPTGAVHA